MQPRRPASEDLVAEAWRRVREQRESATVVQGGEKPPRPAPQPTTRATRPKAAPKPAALKAQPAPAPAKPRPSAQQPVPPKPQPQPPAPPRPRPSRVPRRQETLDLGDPKAVARTVARLLRAGIFLFIVFTILGGFFSIFQTREMTVVDEAQNEARPVSTRSVSEDVVLDSDISEGIVVRADGVTIDCAGHTIRGFGDGVGILLVDRSGVSITNCQIDRFDAGIHIVRGSANTVTASQISGSTVGIVMTETSDNWVTSSIFINNGTGLALMGDASGHTITENIASGNSGDGFSLLDAGPDNVFIGNVAEKNGGFGFLDESLQPTEGRYEGNVCDSNGSASQPDGLCSLSG